ncbi:MAG: hydrolase [Hyphomicrobiales bacterium]|nr:hydrolase [Hyphomicrobiales bacterium]
MRIERDRSQLLIIDVQERLAPAVLEHEGVIAMSGKLIAAAKAVGAPITVSEQYPRGLGPTVAPLHEAIGNEGAFIEKTHFSCLREAPLRQRIEMLRAEGRDQVIVAGMEAHICVAQTVLDLAEEGFHAFAVADAMSSRAAQSRDLALQRMRHAGAPSVTVEMVIFEWLDRAGTPEFKALQALVK